MGANTNIEWADHTFNPWIGCHKISPGCKHCYAERVAKRFGWAADWTRKGRRKVTTRDYWQKPLAWNDQVKPGDRRPRVFCGSLCDVFEPRMDLRKHRRQLFRLIEKTPNLIWMLLTKRNPRHLVPEHWDPFWPPNCWLGVTVESQDQVEKAYRICRMPAPVHFVSCEPLLGRVQLSNVELPGGRRWDAYTGDVHEPGGEIFTGTHRIDWVIVGGESGPGARVMDAEWVMALGCECWVKDIPFFFKQWGRYIRGDQLTMERFCEIYGGNRTFDPVCYYEVGKKRAGRTLGGVFGGRRYSQLPPEAKEVVS